VLAFSAEARYAGQVWQLTLPLPVARIPDAAALARVIERFHALHEQTYSVRAEDPVEFVEWNLVAIGQAEPPPAAEAVTTPHGTALPHRCRRAWLREAGDAVELPVFMAERTASGLRITGPALVQSRLTASLVPAGAEAWLTSRGSLMILLPDARQDP
jgi:N-methylhydantoinase A